MELVRNFKQLNKNDANIAGGKGASLGEMLNAGIPVPPGFVILSTSFDHFLKESKLIEEIDAILDSVNHNEIHTIEVASEKIQGLILNAEILEDIKEEIKTSFKTLDTQYVAVRSSATAEDGVDHAWAGQLNSYLNTTEDNLLEKAKQNLGTIAGALETLYTNLKDLKSVAVKLTADKYKGNAPLIVNFSTIGTRDPAEESTKAGGKKQIEWKFLASADAQCADNGATANCLFKKAGSYKIGVIVSSIDPQAVVPGTAYVTIDVLPSTGKINLKVTTKSIDADIIQYDEEGNLTANRDSLSVPAKEAVDGVRFDASQTKDATQFKWNFGGAQGEIIGKPGDKDIVTMPFTREGKYRIVLEVTTKDGNVSRKVFDLVVSNVSAFISVNPGSTVRAGLKVDFNCVTGRSQGRIDTKWSAQSDSPKADTSKFDTTDQRFALTLEDPAIYKVQCEVKNEQGDTATDELALRVESNPPVARFLAMAGRKNQPSDFTLDASYSYDPDGLNQNIVYTWGLSGEEGKQYKIIEGDKNSEKVLVRFLQKGEYKIQLEAKDANEGKGTKADAMIRVENLLDIDWSESNPVSLKLDNNQQAEAKITILSEQGKNYQIEYGDGEVDSGIFENKKATVTHIYRSARPFMVKVTAYDEDSNENSVTRKIIVGGSDKPLAVARIKMNGELVNTSEMFVVTRKTNLTFDASDSQNTDGSGKNLTYLWDFGNGVKSTKKTTSYIYKDKSPQNPGYFQVKLTVTDDQDSKKTDTDDSVKILVANQKPTLKSLVVIPQGSELRTPITVQVKAFEPRDPDGSIVSYRWWYYDVKNPNIELSTKVTTTPSVLFNIGTRGQEGDLMEYGFNMEMRDDENQVSRASDLLKTQSPPSFTIINGPNKAPVAKFSVSKTNVKVKEAVTFTSVSADPDGTIIGYVWDTEGDGFDNNEQTDKSSIVVNYEQAKTKGIQVRLRVIDNNFGEAVSDPVTIFIMPNGNPPIANFSFASGAGDNKIAFKDATKILDTTKNTTVVSYKWDFDADTDSDNNGVRDDDNESSEKNPIHQYKSSGVYNVKLTVTDNEGAQGVITNIVNVSAAPKTGSGIVAKGALSPTTGSSVGAFSAAPESLLAQMKTTPDASLIDGKIHLKGVAGNVTFDYSSSKGNIVRYEIDKNIYFDGDGDGINDNDKDYTDTKPGSWTTDYQSAWGKVATKLTIYDAAGNKKSTIREITFLGELGGGGNNIFVLPGETSLYGALASMFGFGILKSRRKKRIIKKQT
jgi:PKD repeat protein